MLTAEALLAVLTGILLPAALLIFLTFVPSIIEWKKPRDAGPRPIPGFYKTGTITQKGLVLNLDTEISAPLILKTFTFPPFICNLEAAAT